MTMSWPPADAALEGYVALEGGSYLDGPHPSPELVPPLPGTKRGRAHTPVPSLGHSEHSAGGCHTVGHGHSCPLDSGTLQYDLGSTNGQDGVTGGDREAQCRHLLIGRPERFSSIVPPGLKWLLFS